MSIMLKRHIVNPYRGWYLCGYVPLHRGGVCIRRERRDRTDWSGSKMTNIQRQSEALSRATSGQSVM